jgi:hypothetical protein
MAAILSHSGQSDARRPLTAQQALKVAWYGYLVMLALPFLYLLFVAWSLMGVSRVRSETILDGWFLGAVGYMVVVVPASFFVRSRFFKEYWKGGVVPPADYLKGMYIVWVALEIGGLLSLTGCLVSRSLVPSLMPAVAAFMMFCALWPNGSAMVAARRGDSDDPERYEEPR